MALLPQAEGAVVRLLGGRGFLTEQLHQPSPPPEVHSELVEKIAVHKRVLVGHWGEETARETVWYPADTGHCGRETPAKRQEQKSGQRLYTQCYNTLYTSGIYCGPRATSILYSECMNRGDAE